MRPGLVVVGVLASCAAVSANACSQACSTIGCGAGLSATVGRSDGTFPSGMHQLDVIADGVSFGCTFTFPLPTLPGGGTSPPSCSPGLSVSVGPAMTCTETNNSTVCTEVPGQLVETIAMVGTPAQVQVQQSVDGAAILDVSASPAYTFNAPNGSECPPICRQASVSWTLQ